VTLARVVNTDAEATLPWRYFEKDHVDTLICGGIAAAREGLWRNPDRASAA
jgi:hypothetical protein